MQMALVEKTAREIFNAALDVMCDSFPDLNRRDLSGAFPVVKVHSSPGRSTGPRI